MTKLLATIIAAASLTACATSDPSASDSGATAAPAPASGAPTTPDTGSPATPGVACSASPLTGDGAGALRIGMPVNDLRARCGIVRDGTRPGPEGQPSRVIAVAMGTDTVEAEIVDDRVWRIPVTSPRLRTADGLGVGTPLARLLELRDARPALGEGLYVLSPAHCGVSFQLEDPAGPLAPAQTLEELRGLPSGTVVGRVLLTGCARE